MERVLLALVLVALAVLVAWLVQRRRPEPTRAPTFRVPPTLVRSDFDRSDAPWLVVVFTSSTCDTCAAVADKARALESDAVAVMVAEAKTDADLHTRYGIDAVPLTTLVDAEGNVRRHFFGPVTAADLWSSLAELRDG